MALAALLAIAGCAVPASESGEGTDVADDTEDRGDTIFQMTSVSDFAIAIDAADIATLNAEVANIQAHWDFEHLAAKRTEVKATITYAGTAYPAKLKIKGMASVQGFDRKPSLKIDFDDDFLGLKNLALNSMTQDASMVHEALAYKMYDAAGVPVPRVGYANVSINGQPYGLYVALETIDKHFLERKLGDTKGVIYEATYGGDLRESDLGTPRMVHQSEKTNPTEETDHTRFKELVAAVNSPGDGVFFGEHALVDTEKFLAMMATAYVVGDWDNYITANNYRLYRHTQTGKWSFIPTGVDQTFNESMHPFRGYATRNSELPILFDKCLGSKRCLAEYDRALEKAIVALQAPGGTLAGTLDRRVTLIEAAVAADPKKPFDATQIAAARERAKQLIAARPAEIASARACMTDGREIFAGACGGLLLASASTKNCLDINQASRDDGAQVIQWGCHGAPNQHWLVTPLAEGNVRLVASHSGKCATVVEGGHLAQRTCGDAAEQMFERKPGAGGVQLVAKSNGQCLDIGPAGNDVIVSACADPASKPSQVWLERASLRD